jgi:serine/threonine protein kinase
VYLSLVASAEYLCGSSAIEEVQPLRTPESAVGGGACLPAASTRLMLRGSFVEYSHNGSTMNRHRCVIKCANIGGGATAAVDAKSVAALQHEYAVYKELQRLKQLEVSGSGNSGCVDCYSTHPEGRYIVIEDFGLDLRALLGFHLKNPQLVLEAILLAVQAFHSLGYMHGDIKPTKILFHNHIGGFYTVKLCDLDCAHRFGEICVAATVGTKYYVPPEAHKAAGAVGGTLPASPAMDIFALGLVAWQVLQRTQASPLQSLSDAALDQVYASDDLMRRTVPFLASGVGVDVSYFASTLSVEPAARINMVDLWRAVKLNSLSNNLANLVRERKERAALQHHIGDQVASLSAKMDRLLGTLGARFDSLGASVHGLAESLSRDTLLHSEQQTQQISNIVQEAHIRLVQQLEAATAQPTPTPTERANEMMACLASLQTRIAGSIAVAVQQQLEQYSAHSAAQLQQQQEGSQLCEDDGVSLPQLRYQIELQFQELSGQVMSVLQEQLHSGAQAAQQHEALTQTNCFLARKMQEMLGNLTALEKEARDRQEGQSKLETKMTEALQSQTTLRTMLYTLLSGTHSIPTLAVLLPVVSKSWTDKLSPLRLVRHKYRLYFLCSHTHRIAPCGPDGKGYKIVVPRQWVQDAAPVLRVALVLLKVALLASGIPLPIPDIDYSQHNKFLVAALQLVNNPPVDPASLSPKEDYVMEKTLDALIDVTEADWCAGASQEAAGSATGLLQEGSARAYGAIQDLLAKQKHNIAASSGLRKVTHQRTGNTAWVMDDDAIVQQWEAAQ